jgi:hypothetical protein
MTHHTILPIPASGSVRSARRALTLALVALSLSHGWASAQPASVHDVEAGPPASTSRPIGEAVTRLAQPPAASPPRSSPAWRHPVLLGTAIGAGGAVLWQVEASRGSARTIGPAALVGAGIGAYTGLVVSAVQAARAGRPVSRRVKIGLAAGAVGAVVVSGCACYAAGGCGGVS